MASINHNLPTEVKADQDANHGLNREGMSITKGASGRTLSRVWSDVANRTYRIDPIMLALAEDGLKNLKAFDHQTVMGTLGFWLKEQVDGDHFNVPCGGLGDASLTCFPVPFYGAISDGVYMIDGVPRLSGTTVHETANLLAGGDTYAIGHAGSVAVTNGADATQNNFGIVAPYCAKVTPDTVGACLAFIPGATNGAPVAVGDDYTMIVAVFESKSSPRTFTPSTRWYDSGPSFLSATSGTPVAATSGEWTIYSVTGTAPASHASKITRPNGSRCEGHTSTPQVRKRGRISSKR